MAKTAEGFPIRRVTMDALAARRAKAPPTKKPRPATGKKATRRYIVRPHGGAYRVESETECMAYGMSRADARMFAAMKEAQRGGA